jgi:hypothetical protein
MTYPVCTLYESKNLNKLLRRLLFDQLSNPIFMYRLLKARSRPAP